MVNQILLHISNTPLELVEYCQKKGIAVEAYSPIAHGEILHPPEIASMAEKYGVSVPQLCILNDYDLYKNTSRKTLLTLTETNLIRSEVSRRIRLHQKAETYLTLLHAGIPFYPDVKPDIFCNHREAGSIGMRSLPLFYASREIKELGPETTKIRNSRSMGILMAPQCVYVLYNTGNGVLKWEYRTEVRLNAFLQHYLQGYPYNGHPQIRAIMTGTDMEMAFRLFTSTGGYKKSLFMLDTSFEHFHYLPNTPEGEVLLKLLVHPEIMEKLDNLLLSDLGCRSDSIPLEHDATDASGNPILLAYDFDMQRINRFNTGLNVYGRSGNLICFDFQIPVLKKYLTATIHFSSIDLCKFKRGFLHEP